MGLEDNIGANCNVDAGILSSDIILCAGENAADLVEAFDAESADLIRFHEYRCYRFWKLPRFTLIWTGIGTGCLEPLLWEILRPGMVKRLILIGTAGKLKPEPGLRPYVISEAHLGPTAICAYGATGVLRPRFGDLSSWPTATIISTDFYYDFLDLPALQKLDSPDGARRRAQVAASTATVDLIDMEVAQFYLLCQHLGAASGIQFVAAKGPTNEIGAADAQIANARILLRQCASLARELLARGPVPEASDGHAELASAGLSQRH